MYPVSAAFLAAVKAADRDVSLKIHIDTAFESLDLADADVVQGSFKLSTYGLSGDTMAPGGVKAADLAVTLLNKGGRYDDVQFNGALLTAQYGIKTASGDYEWVPLGTFNIDDVSRPTSVITLGAMDNLLLFDVPFSDVGVTFPATNLQILSAICSHVGVTLKTSSFVNASYTVQTAPDGSLSCRDILSDIAEMAAGFARCDYAGALEIVQWQGVGCVQEVDVDGGSFAPSKNLLNPAVGTLTGVGSAAATQIIQNGNMLADSNSDGVPDGFTLSNANAVSLANGEFTFKATAQYGSCSYGTALTPGHRYFVRANVLAYSPKVKLQVTKGSGQYLNAYHPGDGAYHTLDFAVDIPSGFSSATVYVQDESASGWSNISVKDFRAVDMGTDSSNPFYSMTADQMNTMAQKKGYWEGSSQLGGVDCTVASDGTITLDGIMVVATDIEVSPLLRAVVVSNTKALVSMLLGLKYTVSVAVMSGSANNSSELYVKAHDTSGITYPNNFIFSMHFNSVSKTITAGTVSSSGYSTALNIGDFALQIPTDCIFSAYTFRLQLEQNSVATAWVPYGYLDGDTLDGGDFNRWNNKDYDGGVFSEPSVVVSLGPTNRYNFSVDDSPVKVTGIELDADDQTYLVGTDYYAIHISDNKLIQGDPTDALNAMLDVFQDFAFLPFTSDWQGNPALQPGDIIEQVDRNGVHYRTIITESDFAYRGKCSLSAKGASQLNQGYQSQLTKKVSQLIRSIHQKQVQLDSLDQAIVSATSMIAGALGGYFVNGDTLDDEQYHGNVFICDNVGNDPTHPDVTQAIKVWRWNLGGFGYSSTGINGPFTTAITANGSIVANLVTAGIVTADLIKAGLLQSKDGSSWLNLNTGAFSFSKGAVTFDSTNGLKANQSDGQYTQMTATGLKAVRSDGTYASINGSGIVSTQTDGSYTTLDGSGLMHHDGGSSSEYHYLIYQREVRFDSSGQTVVQLPDEFKGKTFYPSASIEIAYKNPDTQYYVLQNVLTQAFVQSKENGTVYVSGNIGVMGMTTGQWYSATENLVVMLTVIA